MLTLDQMDNWRQAETKIVHYRFHARVRKDRNPPEIVMPR
jgi:hypothetical protein